MALKSMTGFARIDGSLSAAQKSANPPETDPSVNTTNGTSASPQWTIELRSVNNKGLDIRLRVPSGMETLDQQIRKQLSAELSRGSITLNLNLKREDRKGSTELNIEAFNDLLHAAKTASEISNLPMPDLGSLLTGKGILREKETEENEDDKNNLQQAILTDIKTAIENLVTARAEEGTKLQATIEDRLKKISTLTADATKTSDALPETIKARLKENIARLMEQSEGFDPDRLHQEAMLLSVKADITEELDRLRAHVEQADDLLGRSEPVGRRLDFLCQEFNREANTLCSKASSKEMTYIGLELKTIIDQLREQVQNIE